MPPKRVMGMFSDYAPQMKQRRTFDTYPESTPENMQNTPSLATSTIDSWYNTPSGYKPEAYDSGYYDSTNRSYADGGTYSESMGAYGDRAGGYRGGSEDFGGRTGSYGGGAGNYGVGSGDYGIGSGNYDGIESYGNGVGSYNSGSSEIPSYQRDQNYQAPYGKKAGQKKRAANVLSEESTFIDDMALVTEAEKHFRKTRGTSFLNTLKSAMDIVQSIEKSGPGRQYLGLDDWDDGSMGGWGYNQGWGGSTRARGLYGGQRRSMGRGSRGFGSRGAQGSGRGVGRGTARGGLTSGRDFGRGAQNSGQGFQRGRGVGRGQMLGNTRGRGQTRGGKLGFQNQTFQNLNRRGGHMAPVHSLATIQAKTTDFNLSLPEKIRRFCLFCINEGDKVNEIQTIENALTASKLGLKSEFTVSEVNSKMFSGALFLDGVFIARCANKKKKQTKHDVYAKALNVLRTQTVSQIMALKDEGPESVLPEQSCSNAEVDAIMETIESDLSECVQGSCMPNSAVPGLHKLTKYLKQRQASNNCIQSHVQELEQAFTASHSELSHKYDVDLVQVNGKGMFRGRLYIEGILFAGALESQKKKAKQKVSEQAMNFLLTQTIGSLVRGKTLKDLDIDESTFDPPAVPAQASEKELLEKFITNLKANSDSKNRVNILLKFASKLAIPVSTIFCRLGEKTKLLECKLFVSGLLLGTGTGEAFPATRQDAYNTAFELCIKNSVDEIMANCRRIDKTDTDDPNKVEPTNKTKKRMEDSNLMRLKRIANFDLDERLKIDTNEMVIVEHSEWATDRKRNAFCILSESALQNRMLLEWNMKKNDKLFSCTMSLQKIVLADVSASNKASARSLAAAAVLFRLYEKLPVVMSVSKNLPDVWILYEDIRKHAQELKEKSGEKGSIDVDNIKLEMEVNEGGKTDENASENPDGSGRKLQTLHYNKWVVKYVEQLIKEYADKESVDEIIFGSGLPVGDQKRISALTREHGLRFVHRTYQGQTYSSINKRLGPREIYLLLKKGVTSKRYSLVPADELPSYKDIENDIIDAGKIPEPPMQ